MNKNLIASGTVAIQASHEKIWEVLTQPEYIRVYLFGTAVKTDWAAGSPITFEGNYQGKTYLDKGNVLENKPNERLQYNYWSGFPGLEDTPENYSLVTYSIEQTDEGHCNFTWHQQGFASEEGKCHTEEALKAMLQQIKKLAEA